MTCRRSFTALPSPLGHAWCDGCGDRAHPWQLQLATQPDTLPRYLWICSGCARLGIPRRTP